MLLVTGTLLLLVETSDLLQLSLKGFVLLSYVICSLEKKNNSASNFYLTMADKNIQNYIIGG